MLFAFYILLKNSEVLEKWQRRLHYIMVDETQDNSLLQWHFVNLISRIHKNLFVVGDPDQSIYEWRGAKPEYLVNFDQTHAPCKTIILYQNYRSASGILDVANAIISHNKVRVTKDMFTISKAPAKTVHFHAKTDIEESEWVVSQIKARLEQGMSPKDIAILFRASYISRVFEQALMHSEIPYVIYGGIRFFERKEIKDTLAYLKLVDSSDEMCFLRVINTPSRKLGKVFVDKIKATAEAEKIPLYEALRNHIGEPTFAKKGAVSFVKLIEHLRGISPSKRISDLVQTVLEESQLLESIRQDGDQERLDNLEELMQSIRYYENNKLNEESVSLNEYLQDIALYTNLDYKKDDSFVKLMTIHQSKGMEFNVVFLVGMSEGIFPSHRAIRERRMSALEEERRLAYVAVTRAEKELFLTESEGRYHETGEKYPSRFIYEVQKGFLEEEGIVPNQLVYGLEFLIDQTKKIINSQDNPAEFRPKDKVVHPVFGSGEVRKVLADKYEIFFFNLGMAKPINKDFEGLKFESVE